MNSERLLAHFERISEAPDAIARLRRFILDLAVRGKLVEQDPDEATSAHNLDELRKQKDLAYAVEGLRARKPITAIQPTELWFNFPHSWMLCSFDDALVIVSGVTKGQRIPSGETSVDVPYLRVANVQRGWLDLSEVKLIAVRASDVDRYRLANQDILMTEGGDWDKLGRAAIWRGEIACCIHQNHIFRLRTPSDSILPEWVVLYANSDCGRRFFEDSSKQTTNLASINLTQLRSCPIPLPPLAEQHRIVAKVDELMALCDQLEAARQQREQHRERLVDATLQRLNQPAEDPASYRQDASFALQVLPSLTTTPAQIKQLRQTILNLAVRGKLVEQDPEDEPAEELSRQISLERKWLVKTGAIPNVKPAVRDPARLMRDLPINWDQVALGDLCKLVTSGSRGWAEYYSETGVGFIRAQNIRFGRLLLGDMACVQLPSNSEGSRTKVEQADLLVVITGAGVTNPALLNQDVGEAYVSQHVGLIRPTDKSLSPWLLLCLMAPAGGRDELVQRAYGSGKPGLNLDNIRSLTIPLPPLAEQHRIVAKVDELMALCDQLEQQLSQADQQRRRLLEAVLAEALEDSEPALASLA